MTETSRIWGSSLRTPTTDQARLVIVGATGMVGGCPSLRTRARSRRNSDRCRAEARHLAPKAERGFASRLRRLLRTRRAALGSGRSGLLPGHIYRGGVGRRTPQDHRGLYDRVRAVLRLSSPDAAFSFLSGGGADPTGRSRIPYARYKGEAENALIAAGFPSVYIFRPAYIYPVEPRKEPNFSYRLMRAIYPVFRALFPNQVIRADDLARAMVDVVVRRTGEPGHSVFENRDIRAMVESLHTPAGKSSG